MKKYTGIFFVSLMFIAMGQGAQANIPVDHRSAAETLGQALDTTLAEVRRDPALKKRIAAAKQFLKKENALLISNDRCCRQGSFSDSCESSSGKYCGIYGNFCNGLSDGC